MMEPGLLLYQIIAGVIAIGVVGGALLLAKSKWMRPHVPLEPVTTQANTALFRAPAGLCRVVVLRDTRISDGLSIYTIGIDGRLAGATAPGTYLVLDLHPGHHVLTAAILSGMDACDLDLREGEVAFVEHKLRHGLGLSGVRHRRLDDQDGQRLALRSRQARAFV